jgi:type I restriction enzyme M protein
MIKESDDVVRDAASLIRKLWQYCNVLRDDGLSYPDYVEQLTYLLFLKMADEQGAGAVPPDLSWASFAGLDAVATHRHYGHVLTTLGHRDGMLGVIFRNAKNKIRDPRKLRLLIADLIGPLEWSGLSSDLKGDAYEGLLEKNARDTKSGAGQYFTPRPLIEAIVECVAPAPGEIISDPACGTGGFLLAAREYMRRTHPRMTAAQRKHLSTKALRGVELVEEVARLATMNLLLHGVGGGPNGSLPITCADSLHLVPTTGVDVVLTNPPFGVKGSVTYSSGSNSHRGSDDQLTVVRPDFWVATANKQLNFVQHFVSLLKPSGRAAVVVPDNVLFEGGAAAVVRRRLLETCRVHTLLRLPPGIFYAQGVKSNVLFFDRNVLGKRVPQRSIRVYDLRSEGRFSVKSKPIAKEDLAEFVRLYRSARMPQRPADPVIQRWRKFDLQSVLDGSDAKLDFAWERDLPTSQQSNLSSLHEISRLIASDLESALQQIARVAGPRSIPNNE